MIVYLEEYLWIDFDAPKGGNPIAIDFASMGKGHSWVYGYNLVRY